MCVCVCVCVCVCERERERVLRYIRQAAINFFFFIIEIEFLYCPVRTDSFSTNQVTFCVHIFNICSVERWMCAGIQLLNFKCELHVASLLHSFLNSHKTVMLTGKCTEHKLCNLILSANFTRNLVSFTRRTFSNVRQSVFKSVRFKLLRSNWFDFFFS